MLTLEALKYFRINHFEIIEYVLDLSDSFEYLCCGSTAIRYSFALTVQGSTLDVRFILMTKVVLRAVRVKYCRGVTPLRPL